MTKLKSYFPSQAAQSRRGAGRLGKSKPRNLPLMNPRSHGQGFKPNHPKDSPQPQDDSALGLLILNPPPISFST